MSSQHKPPSTSGSEAPPRDPPSSSATSMAATQLSPIGPYILPPPSAIAHQERRALPLPLHPRGPARLDTIQHPSIPRPYGSLRYSGSALEAPLRGLQQPSSVPWQPLPPLERLSRSQPGFLHDLPSPSTSSGRLPWGSVRPDPERRISAGTTSEVPPTPTSAGRDSRLSVDEEARYGHAPLVERPGRRDSESPYPGSATSSSPYSSILSYPSQPQVATSFQQGSNDM